MITNANFELPKGEKIPIITCLHLDPSGTRLAAATENREVIVFIKKNGEWSSYGSKLKTMHDGPVWKVRWAPSEYGQLLATCVLNRLLRRQYHHLEGVGSGRTEAQRPGSVD